MFHLQVLVFDYKTEDICAACLYTANCNCVYRATLFALHYCNMLFTEFTEASSTADTAGMSRHRLAPYTVHYLKTLLILVD